MVKYTKNENDTYQLGVELAEYLKQNNIKDIFIALYGDVGAGKTVFVRGMVSLLSPGSKVKSPSYTIVNEYLKGDINIYHFDFYRINSVSELYFLGFEEYREKGICICEWCEKAQEVIPSDAIIINISKINESERKIEITNPNSI